jgi:hypothetical protein
VRTGVRDGRRRRAPLRRRRRGTSRAAGRPARKTRTTITLEEDMTKKRHNVRAIAALAPALGLVLGVGACGVTGQETDEIDVNPLTHEEASASLERINARPGDPAARLAVERIRPALDRLNGLVARVEVEPGRFVSFYEPSPGQIMVSERGPMDGRRLLAETEVQGQSVADLYRRLAGAEAPAALIAAQSRELEAIATGTADLATIGGQAVSSVSPGAERPAAAGDIATASSALTSADGPWFRDNVCFLFGDAFADSVGCHPNWNDGGWAQASTKTSFLTVAPYSGNGLTVRLQYSGATKFQDAMFNGEWFSWWYHSSTYNTANGPQYNSRTHRWDILQATGDWFHWSYAFKWTCFSLAACDEWPE